MIRCRVAGQCFLRICNHHTETAMTIQPTIGHSTLRALVFSQAVRSIWLCEKGSDGDGVQAYPHFLGDEPSAFGTIRCEETAAAEKRLVNFLPRNFDVGNVDHDRTDLRNRGGPKLVVGKQAGYLTAQNR